MKDFARIGQRRFQDVPVRYPGHGRRCPVKVMGVMMVTTVSVDGLVMVLHRRYLADDGLVVVMVVHDGFDSESRSGRRGHAVRARLVVVLLVLAVLDLELFITSSIPLIITAHLRWKEEGPFSYLVQIVDGTRVAAAGHTVLSDGGQDHSLGQALLEAAILAPIPLRFGDLAVAFRHACVHPLVLYCPLKESLTPERNQMTSLNQPLGMTSLGAVCLPFTGDDAVMQSGRLVLTDHADHGRIVFLLNDFHPTAVFMHSARMVVIVVVVEVVVVVVAGRRMAAASVGHWW